MAKIDFLAIASESDIKKRCEEISAEFGYSYVNVDNVDQFAEKEAEFAEVTFILVSAEKVQIDAEIAGMVQVIRQIAPDAYILVAIDSKLDPKVAVFVKKSGANAVFVGTELRHTSKLEFVASQKIQSSFLPIKVNEIILDSVIDCPLYHLMPLNRKYLPIIRANEPINAKKLEKLKEVGEIYVRREHISHFQKYSEKFMDKSAAGLSGRCRAQFLSLFGSYVDLILMISDQSESTSFKEGAALYERCERLASDLMNTLGAVGDAWSIINNSSIGQFGSVERAPSIAAYAGLLSLNSGIGVPTQVMTATFMSDIGMIELSPKTTKKIRKGEAIDSLSAEEQQAYRNHPIASLEKALSRKLQIPEDVKNTILCTHERVDMKGFPKRPRPEKIPLEAMLVQISQEIDQATLIRLNAERPKIQDVKKTIFEQHYAAGNVYSLLFLEKMKSQFLS